MASLYVRSHMCVHTCVYTCNLRCINGTLLVCPSRKIVIDGIVLHFVVDPEAGSAFTLGAEVLSIALTHMLDAERMLQERPGPDWQVEHVVAGMDDPVAAAVAARAEVHGRFGREWGERWGDIVRGRPEDVCAKASDYRRRP